MNTAKYAEFLRVHDSTLPGIYHAVRKIPYGSVGERDPLRVIEGKMGSCSGKHMLLRDLLREVGYRAEIITMFTMFNRGMPSHQAMPEDLRRMIEYEEICDYHHYVRVRDDSRWLKLDATWHDALIPFGFAVNHAWKGEGDTKLAATPLREYPDAEDLAALKADLVAQLAPDQREKRDVFFRRLTEWMMTL
jgi:hypothetical protein